MHQLHSAPRMVEITNRPQSTLSEVHSCPTISNERVDIQGNSEAGCRRLNRQDSCSMIGESRLGGQIRSLTQSGTAVLDEDTKNWKVRLGVMVSSKEGVCKALWKEDGVALISVRRARHSDRVDLLPKASVRKSARLMLPSSTFQAGVLFLG